jgi:hypothetical protein
MLTFFAHVGQRCHSILKPDEALDGSSHAVTLLDFPLRMPRLRFLGKGACVTCILPGSLRTVGGSGSMTLLRGDSVTKSAGTAGLLLSAQFKVVSPTLNLLRRTKRG